ncbi:MAG: bifunctional nuclease family protein [Thermoanaerobaculia bacterium]|nr:bifunctional nuclease family protein [Thermoanaerobaculia bacterium]
MSEPQLVPMEVRGLMLDPRSNVPIVVLREQEGAVFLPIWIGIFEANAIALRLEGVDTPRPLTHDLLRSVFEHLDTRVERVIVSDLKDSTFYARIILRKNGEESELDSRPSDAIALALRTDAPIFVNREVLEKAKAVDLAAPVDDEEKLKQWLEELEPEDLGDYTM